LLKREFEVLSNEMRLVRGLEVLREEVKTARAEVPKLPAIAAESISDLERKQGHLERELAKVRDRVSKARVNQSLTDYRVAEMRKEMDASGSVSIEMEYETTSSHFQMRASHPQAAAALREFAGQIIDGQRNGTLWLPGRAGNA
jgi:hypothetical protein